MASSWPSNASSPGSWLAALWAQEGRPFVLGHALSRKAIHGGKAKNDTLEAEKIAVLLRGGMLPQASGSPAAMRATRELLRRRMPLLRKRAEVLTPIQKTNRQDNLPEMGQKLADKANRARVAARFSDPAGQKRIDVDLALLGHDDSWRRGRELSILKTSKPPHANTRYWLRTVPGIGELRSLILRYARHAMHRFPRGQDFVSYGRLGTCAQESAGKRYGTAGPKRGNAYLTWAVSEAAVRCLRDKPAGQKSLARVEKHHGQGKALTV